jgi:hypothetical protein
MKKIPTLFTRIFEGRKIVGITEDITPGCEDAFYRGEATIKIDGSCCAIIDGELYKRYDAKKGKNPPGGAIPCCEPDPVTGHWPHWVKADNSNPSDKWFYEAFNNSFEKARKNGKLPLSDGTYEAVGPHFNGNPYGLCDDILEPHGVIKIGLNRTFEAVKEFLENNYVEGLVFWLNGEPVCKIKRSDFGLPWAIK